jgi:hypothetical protein
VKAGLIKQVEEYKGSSFCEYVNQVNLVDVNFSLEMISDDREKAIQIFIEYTNEVNDHVCLDIDNETKQRIMDEEARAIIKTGCKVKNAIDLQNLDAKTRNTYLRKLKEKYNLSIRQIERLTGINSGLVLKA